MAEEQKITTGKVCCQTSLCLNSIPLVLFLVVGLFSKALMAECFCLEDENDNLRHSCRTQQQGIRTITHCRDDAGEPYKLDYVTGWTRLKEGEGRCNPCQQGNIPVEEGPIRGDDDKKPAQAANDDRAQ